MPRSREQPKLHFFETAKSSSGMDEAKTGASIVEEQSQACESCVLLSGSFLMRKSSLSSTLRSKIKRFTLSQNFDE